MHKIIVANLLGHHQKRTLIIVYFSILVITFGLFLNTEGFTTLKVSLVLFLLIIFQIFYIKKGLLTENNQLYKGQFLFGVLIRKTRINASGNPFFTIHKFKNKIYDYDNSPGLRKAWEPNLNYIQHTYYLYITNENQSKKEEILTFENSEIQNQVILFLEQNSTLIYKKV
uniref:hypothetical protein n=1 Tax=Flavobacterium sp. TaxID=239 RepID=UPI00404A0B97